MLKIFIAFGVLLVIACTALLTSCDWSKTIINKISGHEEIGNANINQDVYD